MYPPIPGLTLAEDFITPDEETRLLGTIDQQPWIEDLKRRVQHYGYRYDYRDRRLHRDSYLGPLPEWLSSIRERIEAQIGEEVDQTIVNEYLPGQGIYPHIDCQPCFGEHVISLTLGSGCIMTFDPGREASPEETYEVYLSARSAVFLQGPARHQWRHGIPQRKTDEIAGVEIPRGRRVSLTFRKAVLP